MSVAVRKYTQLPNLKTLHKKVGVSLHGRQRFHTTDEKLSKLKWNDHAWNDFGVADYKPIGLWYSFGNRWLKFLERQSSWYDWSLERLDEIKYLYQVRVNTSKMLRLRTDNDFIAFTAEFGVELPSRGPRMNYLINWKAVGMKYAGIEVPECEEWMEDFLWFDGWDCASGCVWHQDAFKDYKLIKKF